MSYQPQTEAATSRFLNVEEAGKTLMTTNLSKKSKKWFR